MNKEQLREENLKGIVYQIAHEIEKGFDRYAEIQTKEEFLKKYTDMIQKELDTYADAKLAEVAEEIEKLKRLSKSQIKMPEGFNPDKIGDIVYCAQHNITDAFNEGLSDSASIVKSKMSKKV